MPPWINVHQGPVNVNLFGDWLFAIVINLKRGHNGIGWCPQRNMDTWPQKQGHTKKRKACEDRWIRVITRVRRGT